MKQLSVCIAVFCLSLLPCYADSQQADVARLLQEAKTVVESQSRIIQQQQAILEKTLKEYEILETRFYDVQKNYNELLTKHSEILLKNEELSSQLSRKNGIIAGLGGLSLFLLYGGLMLW